MSSMRGTSAGAMEHLEGALEYLVCFDIDMRG